MARLAFITIGILYELTTHPRSRGFHERSPLVMKDADAADGFIRRSVLDPQTLKQSWGDLATTLGGL